MVEFELDTTITANLVGSLIHQFNTENICITIKNTKKQSSAYLQEVALKYPNTVIRVIGGLDPKKAKYQHEVYRLRTLYTPWELSKIVSIFETIERKINLSWTDMQKAMFIYQEICNNMIYQETYVNGRDISRSLLGLLYHQAVCAGFSLILKEALDRIGIPNEYQSIQGVHSWNIAYIDDAYRALELTWECCNKDENGCNFKFFNRNLFFYRHKYHRLKDEPYEREYRIVPYLSSEIREAEKTICIQDKTIFLPDDKKKVETLGGKNYLIGRLGNNLIVEGSRVKYFLRDDGSQFVLIPGGTVKSMKKYYYLELDSMGDVRVEEIYSESDLEELSGVYNAVIANSLLSPERLDRKVKMFNGYVGYIGEDYRLHYDQNFEVETLNIRR